MKPVPLGLSVQFAPPPDSVAVAVPVMPGTVPDTTNCAFTAKVRVTCVAAK